MIQKSPANVLRWVLAYLYQVRKEFPHTPLAIVFDIDDTVLSGTYPRSYALPHAMAIYKVAHRLGIKVIFITARVDEDDNTEFTRKELRKLGFSGNDPLYLMPDRYLVHPNFSQFKHGVRDAVERAGYHVMLSMGDTWHDLMLVKPFARVDPSSLMRKVGNKVYAVMLPPDPHEPACVAIKVPARPDDQS